MSIADNLQQIKSSLPEGVTLVAVSKLKPASAIEEAYAAGHRDFGENRVDEFVEKAEQLPKDITWHFIGHLQTKKAKKVVPHANLIHGVDTAKLLIEINSRAMQNNKVQDVLIQVHIAQEESKSGFTTAETRSLLSGGEWKALTHVNIIGLMGMATFTEDMEQVRKEFQTLKQLFDELHVNHPNISVLSMGMSGDHGIAIEEGSTMIRIGSAIFGARN